jgi:hypothetical protein
MAAAQGILSVNGSAEYPGVSVFWTSETGDLDPGPMESGR